MDLREIPIKRIFTDDEPVTCQLKTPIKEALKLMDDHHIGALCIVGECGQVMGIFTERDLLKAHKRIDYATFMERPISEFMTPEPKVLTEEEGCVHQCMTLMRIGKFRHVIVVNKKHEPVRMISIRDAFFFLCDDVIYGMEGTA